jgi:ubiquitin carboxyl-terminal hydrolase 14
VSLRTISTSLIFLIRTFQRKVKFPTEFDALDLVTDELKERMTPISRLLKQVEKDRSERRKVRKRTKGATTAAKDKDVEMKDAEAPPADPAPASEPASGGSVVASAGAVPAPGTEDGGDPKGKKAAGELEDESVYREREAKELEALIDPELKKDVGCSASGLYDLVGEYFDAESWYHC